MRGGARHTGGQHGQASVELVALLPAVALVVLIAWQLVAAAHTWTVAGGAARAGARAHEVGAPHVPAARAALPAGAARRAAIAARATRAGAVRVRVAVPLRARLRWMPPVTVTRAAEAGRRP